jgi:hypothetical protein
LSSQPFIAQKESTMLSFSPRNWFGPARCHKSLRKRLNQPLQVELLEDRWVPAIGGTPSQNFVAQAYLDQLGRTVDSSGLAFWSKLVDQGVSRTQVVFGIQNSQEFRTNEIEDRYHHILGRDADPVGLNGSLAFLTNGGRIEQLENFLYGSAEFFQKSGGTDDGFLTALYIDLLGRPTPNGSGQAIDPVNPTHRGDRAGWDSALASGITSFQVATLISQGSENLTRQVGLKYQNILGRTADAAGLNLFVTFEPALGLDAISAILTGSDEHFQNIQKQPPTIPGINTTSTALASSANGAAALNTPVIFTATVSPNKDPRYTASGTVTFLEGTTVLDTEQLGGNGTAASKPLTLPVGDHAITVAYSGDANFAASTSPPLTQTVSGQATTTALATSSPANTSNLADAVTFTATVTPSTLGSFAASGTVTFTDNGTPLANGTVALSGGAAMYRTTTLPAGSHVIKAAYSGDSNFAASSGTVAQTVNQMTTITSVTSDSPTSNKTQPVTFTAVVTPTAVGSFVPSGTVTFTDNGTPLLNGTVPVSGGTAKFTTDALAPSTDPHVIKATYNGDTNFSTSSGTVNQTVNLKDKVITALALMAAPAPSNFTDAVTFTATVSPAQSPEGFQLTGTVTFTDNVATLPMNVIDVSTGTATPAGIVVKYTTPAGFNLPAGDNLITAAYSGNTNFNARSNNLTQHVNAAPTTVTQPMASPAAPLFGQQVTLTAQVSTTVQGIGQPSAGDVTFQDTFNGNTTTLGSEPINSQGLASLTLTTPLAKGTHQIVAIYNGDNHNFAASSPSSALSLSVGLATPSVSITPSGSQPAIALEGSVVVSATVSNGVAGVPFQGQVTFTVDGTPVSVNVGGTTQQTVGVDANGNTPRVTIGPLSAANVDHAHVISATYGSDPNYNNSSVPAGQVLKQVVNQATPTVSFTSLNNLMAGTETFTATVTSNGPASGPLALQGGTLTFTLNGRNLMAVVLSSGALTGTSESVTLNAASPGSVTVSFQSSDPNYNTNTPPTDTKTIGFQENDPDGLGDDIDDTTRDPKDVFFFNT